MKKDHIRKTRTCMYMGISFMLVDMMFFTSYWSMGNGYVYLGPEIHSDVIFIIGQVWAILHLPVEEIFGPIFSPYFGSHDGRSIGYIAYVLTCFIQMFLVGALLGLVFRRKQLKTSPS